MAELMQYKLKEYVYTWQIEKIFESLDFRGNILTPTTYISAASWIRLKLSSCGPNRDDISMTLCVEKSAELELTLVECELSFDPELRSSAAVTKQRCSNIPGWKFKWNASRDSKTTATIKCFLFLGECQQNSGVFPFDDYHVLKLSRDVGKLLDSGMHSDLTLDVRNKKFKVHRVILESRAPELVKLLRLDNTNTSEREIEPTLINPDVLALLLDYWYTGKLDVSRRQLPMGLHSTMEALKMEDLQSKLCIYPYSSTTTTKITTQNHDLQWPLKNFTSLLPKKEVISPVFYFPQYSEFQLKLLVKSQTMREGETKIEMFLLWQPNYVAVNCVLRFRTSVVDALGDKVYQSSFDGKGILKYQKIADIDKSELEDSRRTLLPNDTLTLHCEITLQKIEHDLSGSAYSAGAVEDQMLCCSDFGAYSDDLSALINNENLSDMTIVTQERRFSVHKSIMSVRCPQFFIKHPQQGFGSAVYNIPEIDSNTMLLLIVYLYSGKVDLSASGSATKLYFAAYQYDLFLLKEKCLVYLRTNMTF